MISFPQAKLNLGLSIVSKRPDGFHNLETVYYPLPLRDVLEIIPTEKGSFHFSGLAIPGAVADNLILKAIGKIKNEFPQIPELDIYLYKNIPMGAGLGGGSSNAAACLAMMNQLLALHIPAKKLTAMALELGSDCPFFLQGHPCFARGRGEILEPIDLDLSAYSLLLIHPGLRIDTRWAFSTIQPFSPASDLKKNIAEPVENWRKTIFNDFEKPVFKEYPILQQIKSDLYEAGALYAAMTGSGSTMFGIFKKGQLPVLHPEGSRQTRINE